MHPYSLYAGLFILLAINEFESYLKKVGLYMFVICLEVQRLLVGEVCLRIIVNVSHLVQFEF
jgi:hypothetical protein